MDKTETCLCSPSMFCINDHHLILKCSISVLMLSCLLKKQKTVWSQSGRDCAEQNGVFAATLRCILIKNGSRVEREAIAVTELPSL